MTKKEKKYKEALESIALLGGNLSDEAYTTKSGPNDGVHRGILYTGARAIAKEALLEENEKNTIDVWNGYSIRFDQRGRGQETPYWVGVIFKDGVEVGHFSNSGRGECTNIVPFSIRDDFCSMLQAEIIKLGFSEERAKQDKECFENVLLFAEEKGYFYPSKDMTFPQYCKIIADMAFSIALQNLRKK